MEPTVVPPSPPDERLAAEAAEESRSSDAVAASRLDAPPVEPASVPPRRRPWPPLLAAGFLTAIPLPGQEVATDAELAAALPWFPVVGAVLGALVAGLDAGLRLVLPLPVAGAVDLAALALLSGGLHLDALMDTCDGLFGGHTVEQRLAIMRDSRVSSFGVIAGVLALLLQFSALGALSSWSRVISLITVLACSRWAMVLAILAFPPARPDGLGAHFRAAAHPPVLLLATVAVAVLLIPAQFGALPLLGGAALLTALLGRYIRRQVGGLSGDSYGAIGELVTTLGFVFYAAHW